MTAEVRMPQLGLTMTEGEIVRLLVSEGERVVKGQPLLEIQTDKITSELEAPEGGVVQRILVKDGDVIPVTGLLAVISAPGEAAAEPQRTKGEASQIPVIPAAKAHPPRVSLPLDAPHRASPYARRMAKELGIELARIPEGGGAQGRITGADVSKLAQKGHPDHPAKVSPVARRLLNESGLSKDAIAGSGPLGLIMKKDVQGNLGGKSDGAIKKRVRLTGVRAIVSERMAQSAHSAAAVTLTTEADATALVALRDGVRNSVGTGTGMSLPYDALFARIAARALEEHPALNALLVGDEIQVLGQVNLGVAVDTPQGLLVPVLKGADQKTLRGIAQEVVGLIDRARTNKLLPEDLQGGTFTITNLGMNEIDAFTPIINPPQIAILGIGRILPKPVAWHGQIRLRNMVFLSLTFDHRAVDGAPAARFLQRVKMLLEDPGWILP